ncbi:hypothetical protein [Gimesia panareensis]|uniref:hypothetical protein n=1 Tax=Gimesia panareensis TaxID=2527978 RepID=UPI00118A21D3|nr:hypothetical protein [Gimesia panareensis]QDU51498.1 hypothetical protein Pan110_38640 [Gimesia panareensis]
MKIGLLTRKLTTVYLLLALFGYLTVGCLRQSADVISQSTQTTENSLIAASNSSGFNYFDQKKKVSAEDKPGRVKLGAASPVAQSKPTPESMQPAPVKISQAAFEDVERMKQEARATADNQPQKKSAQTPAENWRSKSLISSAKKYPTKLMEACQQNTDRIQQASGAISNDFSRGIKRLVGADQSEPAPEVLPENQLDFGEKHVPQRTAADEFRADEVSRYLEQADQELADPQIRQLGQELQQDLQQSTPVLEDVSQEMRHLQINSIMERANRELKEKNFEYAQFLAEQALETSYRGHVAFGLDEESPQMLLQKIKQELASNQPAALKQTGHSEPLVQSNSGQRVPSFTPSRVHPLKRRATPRTETKPAAPRAVQSAPSPSASDELPLIVPRNMGTTPVQPQQTFTPQQNEPKGSVSLEPPAFEPSQEVPTELPPIEQPVQREAKPVQPEPSIKLELEEAPVEPQARIQLSGPEAVTREPASVPEPKSEASSGPGPQLMLPKLPAVPGDLTSQSEMNGKTHATMTSQSGQQRGTPTSNVKFRSRLQERNGEETSPFVEQKRTERREEASQGGAGLKLDEIEWDLAERKRPAVKSGWGGITTLLLAAGGLIILLLSAIIVVLLRRGASSS